MITTIVLSLFSGLFLGNGIPHFTEGNIGKEHPIPFGRSAAVNVITGWIMFVIAGILWHYADKTNYSVLSYTFGALGLLLIGLFHANVWIKNPEFYKQKK
jgi:hypothetical protein